MTKLNNILIICEEIIHYEILYCKDINNNIILFDNDSVKITLKGCFFLEKCNSYYITSQYLIDFSKNNIFCKDIIWFSKEQSLGFPIYECLCINITYNIDTIAEFLVIKINHIMK